MVLLGGDFEKKEAGQHHVVAYFVVLVKSTRGVWDKEDRKSRAKTRLLYTTHALRTAHWGDRE